ncbi:c-type cytochrome [Allorhizobium borbori]|uniref:Cytochrome c n=1 Tax=Allorhizobium borbori TaxID=485907 RepID=A0A7W6JYX7_9HYPH|nr:cytochrome c family protein [Allorhizobium borbori]MBB4102100.1 cytochrome c [Allorhizobium borbori]
MNKMLVLLALAASATAAHAGGDATKGAAVFKKNCSACHTATEPKNKVGPYLGTVIGRPVATYEGFRYSKAMTEFGADGKVWDEARLAEYLPKPKDLVKGTTMAFAGLKTPDEVTDLIAYLKAPQ